MTAQTQALLSALKALGISLQPQLPPSPDLTSTTAIGTYIIDAAGGAWVIQPNRRIAYNGVEIPYTANVTWLGIANGKIWQQGTGQYYPFTGMDAAGVPTSGPGQATSPLAPPAPAIPTGGGAGAPATAATAFPAPGPIPVALWTGTSAFPQDPAFNIGWEDYSRFMGKAPTMEMMYAPVQAGRMDTWVKWFQDYAGWMKGNPRTANVIPYIGWGFGNTPEGSLMTQTAAGTYNKILTDSMDALAAQGYREQWFRFGWEMNGGWYEWCLDKPGADKWIEAFRTLAMTAKAHAAQAGITVRICWNPNAAGLPFAPASYWPGADAVDVILLDQYSEPVDGGWSSYGPLAPSAPNQFRFADMVAMAKQYNKPIGMGEVGGTNPGFVNQVIQGLLTAKSQGLKIACMGFYMDAAYYWTKPVAGSPNTANLNAIAALWKGAFGAGGTLTN